MAAKEIWEDAIMGFALYLLVVTIVVCEEISNTDIGLKTHYKAIFLLDIILVHIGKNILNVTRTMKNPNNFNAFFDGTVKNDIRAYGKTS